MELIIVPLAQKKLRGRDIPLEWVERTVRAPEQTVAGYGGRVVHQRRYQVPGRQEQLLRVVCEQAATKCVVVTAYLTSDVQRYWEG